MGVSSSAAWLRALPKLPGGVGRFLPCGVGSHMSRSRRLGWNQRSRGLSSRPLESCHHQYLSAVCGVLGYPEGSAAELLDGSLKLRYCTTAFTKQFLPWVLPRLGRGVLLPLIISWIVEVTFGNGSGKPGRHVLVHFHLLIRIQGIQRRGDGKDCASLPPKELGSEVGVPRNVFLLVLDEVCIRGSLETSFGGNRLRVPAGQSIRRGSVHWHWPT